MRWTERSNFVDAGGHGIPTLELRRAMILSMLRFLLILMMLITAVPAHADIYAQPTWGNLIKTLVRYGALDLTDNKILDEYAIVTDCDIYKAFSANDFRWNQIRDQMRDSVKINLTKFPASYVYEDKLALDHYDFDQQMYRFSDKNPLQKVNAFFLYRSNGLTCGDMRINYLPKAFRAILDESVSLPGLPLTQKSADALLRRMDANNNAARMIFVRFNLHINYIGKVDKNADTMTVDKSYVQAGAAHDAPVVLNAQVDTIDFFEDEHYHKLLYSYQP